MEEIGIVGLDLAKRVFQIHAVGVGGEVIAKRQLKRSALLGFSPSWLRARWEWRPAGVRTSGRERSRLSVIRCASCRRAT